MIALVYITGLLIKPYEPGDCQCRMQLLGIAKKNNKEKRMFVNQLSLSKQLCFLLIRTERV